MQHNTNTPLTTIQMHDLYSHSPEWRDAVADMLPLFKATNNTCTLQDIADCSADIEDKISLLMGYLSDDELNSFMGEDDGRSDDLVDDAYSAYFFNEDITAESTLIKIMIYIRANRGVLTSFPHCISLTKTVVMFGSTQDKDKLVEVLKLYVPESEYGVRVIKDHMHEFMVNISKDVYRDLCSGDIHAYNLI